MNDIQKKTYIDKDETDSMEKTNKFKKKQIVCTYNNETCKDYKQYTILSMKILLPIILIKMLSCYALALSLSISGHQRS